MKWDNNSNRSDGIFLNKMGSRRIKFVSGIEKLLQGEFGLAVRYGGIYRKRFGWMRNPRNLKIICRNIP